MLSVASSSSLIGIRKRKNEKDYNNPDSPGTKVSRLNHFYFMLESESDVPSSATEDTESVLSIQNKSTDIAKDTSDTSSKMSQDESDLESLAGLEYEPVTPEHEEDCPFDSYSSGTDSDLPEKRLGETSEKESSDSLWAEADYSSGASDQKTLPTTLKLRRCIKCKAETNQYQYCRKCYKVRKNFFPPRPKCSKKKKAFCKKKLCIKEPKLLSLKLSQSDSWMESTSTSQEQLLTPTNPVNTEELCNLCCTNQKDGAFIHNRWVHVTSCYQCSLKQWFERKRCPLCNSKIRQVLRVAIG